MAKARHLAVVPDPDDEPGHELAVIEPTSVELTGRDSYRLPRPTVTGIRHAARRGSVRLVFELFIGVPKRAWWLVRVWVVGVAVGLYHLVPWLFARDIAADDKVRPHADRYAKWRLSLFCGGHLAVLIGCAIGTSKLESYPWVGYKLFWTVPAVWAVVALAYGIHKNSRPYVSPVAPRARTDATTAAINEALLGMGKLKPATASNQSPGRVTMSALPRSIGGGHETTWTLPVDCGLAARDIVTVRERLAGSFATPLDQFHVKVGRHAAEFVVWQTDRDPFGGLIPAHPLVGAKSWDVWQPAPWGLNYMRQPVLIGLVFTSVLIGARPRQGKSFSARSALVGPILDPHVRFACFNGKGGPTWDALKPMCDEYVSGGDVDEIQAVAAALKDLLVEMRARHKRIPGSKLTPALSRDPAVDAPIKIVVVDEAQIYVGDEKHGKAITEDLVTLAKVGPSAGMSLVIITQNPHSEGFPTQLKSVMGARMALPVMTFHDSNVILGPDMSKLGYDASTIRHKGVGYFRPDEDANGQPDSPDRVQLIRTFAIGAEQGEDDWVAVCDWGRELRREMKAQVIALREPEPASDDEQLNATELYVRLSDYAPESLPNHVTDHDALGRWLEKKGSRSHKLPGGKRVRSLRDVEDALDLPKGALSHAHRGAHTDDLGAQLGTPGHPLGTDPGAPSGHPTE